MYKQYNVDCKRTTCVTSVLEIKRIFIGTIEVPFYHNGLFLVNFFFSRHLIIFKETITSIEIII